MAEHLDRFFAELRLLLEQSGVDLDGPALNGLGDVGGLGRVFAQGVGMKGDQGAEYEEDSRGHEGVSGGGSAL